MKQLLLICAMVMGQSVLAADEKLITDPIVEKAIRRQIGKPNGGLTKVDLAKVTMLALRSTKITDENAAELGKALPKCRIFHSYKKDEPAPSFLLPLLLPTPKQDGLNRKRSNGFA